MIIIAALLLLFVYLAFIVPLRLRFLFLLDSKTMFSAAWPPWLRIEATLERGGVFISVFLFRWKVMSHRMRRRKRTHPSLWKAVSLRGVSIRTRYGLREPHLTGLLLAPVSAIGFLSWVKDFEIVPDFLPAEEYFLLEGSAVLNVGETLLNMLGLITKKEKSK
jgi:hypothetical protein